MAREALNWSNLSVDNVPEGAKELYTSMWDAMEAFEEYFQERAPKGKRVVFSYRKGNNGLTIGVALANATRATNGRLDWLPAQ